MGKNSEFNHTFSFDNLKDYTYLKNLFEKANFAFLQKDFVLIESDTNEKSMCGALKSRLEQYLQAENINDYFVDVEYNRNGGEVKTIIDDQLEIVKITCDLILHSRGLNIKQDNLLALEMKKSYRSQKAKDSDRKRLMALTKSTYDNDIWSYDGKTFPKHVCRYIIGIYYEIDLERKKVLLEFYRQGMKVAQETLYLQESHIAAYENKIVRKSTMDKVQIFEFIAEQKTAFIASINEQGFPVIKAMLAPRKINGNEIYFTTNTSSNKIKHYLANNKACIYFYKRGKFNYQGVSITGEMQICTDQAIKDEIWRIGDKMFYKHGVTDLDYCVLKFTGKVAEYYCNFKTETIEL